MIRDPFTIRNMTVRKKPKQFVYVQINGYRKTLCLFVQC